MSPMGSPQSSHRKVNAPSAGKRCCFPISRRPFSKRSPGGSSSKSAPPCGRSGAAGAGPPPPAYGVTPPPHPVSTHRVCTVNGSSGEAGANAGSSVGVSKVRREVDLDTALRNALAYDRKVLVEAAIDAREIECAVLGNDDPQASVPGEIVVTHRDGFYSYDAKYVDPDGASWKIPADLPPATPLLRAGHSRTTRRVLRGTLPGGLEGAVADRAGQWSLDDRDPGWLDRSKYLGNPLMDLWFRMEIEGWERLPPPPADGRVNASPGLTGTLEKTAPRKRSSTPPSICSSTSATRASRRAASPRPRATSSTATSSVTRGSCARHTSTPATSSAVPTRFAGMNSSAPA